MQSRRTTDKLIRRVDSWRRRFYGETTDRVQQLSDMIKECDPKLDKIGAVIAQRLRGERNG